MQLMAEDDSLYSSAKITGLDDADIRTNIYEGGFKSWECSYDLANFLLDRSVHHPDLDASSPIDHVLEVILDFQYFSYSYSGLMSDS